MKSAILIADQGQREGSDNLARLPLNTREICVLPDRRAYRSMSRAAVMLTKVGLDLEQDIKPYVDADPFQVGVYAALNNGPEDYECVEKLSDCPAAEFHSTYKKQRSPKHYLKQLPNLAPAQLGIFLGIQGPTNTYTHSQFGVLHALRQAVYDLRAGKVSAALVCSSFSLEDPLLTERTRAELPVERTLAEGAAALLLTADDVLELELENLPESDVDFGIATILIQFVKEENTMRTETEILAALQTSVATVLEIEPKEVVADAHLVDTLGAESIDFLDISSELEKSIDVEVDFSEIAGSDPKNLVVRNVVAHIATELRV